MAAGSTAARQTQRQTPTLAPCCVAWEARRSRGLHPPPTCQNKGLSARPYASNQTPIMVNARLPKENLVRQRGGGGGNGLRRNRAPISKTARLLAQTGGGVAVRLDGALRRRPSPHISKTYACFQDLRLFPRLTLVSKTYACFQDLRL